MAHPSCRGLLFLIGLAAVAPSASAAPKPPAPAPLAGQTRQGVTIEAVDRHFGQAAAGAGAQPPAPGRPAVRLEEFLADRRARLKRITDAQIDKMRSLIGGTTDDDPQKPDFYFRLGELQAENRHYFSDRARELDEKIFQARGGDKATLGREQQAFERQAGTWRLEAVKSYLAATRYPRYERLDEVLFRLAAELTTAKKEGEAREFLLRLIKDYPRSRFVPDAYLAFAELYFDRGEIDSALRFYEKVEQFPSSHVYPYAVYKDGWCRMNLGDHKAALASFVRVVQMGDDPNGGARGPARRDLEPLIKEARKDIVVAYARVGGPDRAWDFFRRTGGESATRMMEALAERYWEQGQGADSTRVYRKLMAEAPASATVCAWQTKVLRNALSLNDKRDQAVELERLGAVVDHAAPPTARERSDECRAGFHDAARELALVWHREGQKTRDADTYRLAERAYRLFLAHFPSDRDAYEMTYYTGELLWSLGRWRDAAEIYTQVVAAKPDGKYVRDAAQAAMLAWQNTLRDGATNPLPEHAERGPRTARAIPTDQQKLIAALQTFQKYLPDAPEVPAAIYREAYINYDHDHFDRAEALFRQIIDRFPTHQLVPFAVNLYLDSLNAEGKSRELGVAVRAFLERPALQKDSELMSQMLSLLSDVLEQEAREQERRGDPKECGRSFVAAAETWPSHERHAQRLWNGAQCFQNAHLIGQALKAWEALQNDHPRDVLAQRALLREGAGYHQLAYYIKAADAYEAFAKKFPGEPEAVGALGNAIAFREGLGEGEKAIADMRSFVSFYGARKPADAAGVYFQMSGIYESQGKPDELARHLRDYLDRWGRHGGVDREVEAHFRLGELAWRGSCAHGAAEGSCVSVERQTSSRGREVLIVARRKYGKERQTQCGPLTKTRIVVWPRDAGRAASAEEHFRRAIALWKAGDGANPILGIDRDARRAAGALAAAGAAFYLAEKSYEDFLRVKFPQNLDFTRPRPQDGARRQAAVRKRLEDSQRRFSSYLAEKASGLERARNLYLDVIHQRQAQWAIAAAARIGQLHQDFAGQLYTAEIPKDLPETDAWGNHPRDLYCAELEDRAGKIEAQAIEGFAACLTAATQQSWFNEWSHLCERELNQLQPVEFPLSSEIKPTADNTPTSIAAVPLIRELN